MSPWALIAFSVAALQPAADVVDETFDIAISERLIERQGYEAGHAVRLEAQGLGLDAGVRLTAGHIRVLLRNVHGRVRFRADLGPLASVLRRRPAPGAIPEGGRR